MRSREKEPGRTYLRGLRICPDRLAVIYVLRNGKNRNTIYGDIKRAESVITRTVFTRCFPPGGAQGRAGEERGKREEAIIHRGIRAWSVNNYGGRW